MLVCGGSIVDAVVAVIAGLVFFPSKVPEPSIFMSSVIDWPWYTSWGIISVIPSDFKQESHLQRPKLEPGPTLVAVQGIGRHLLTALAAVYHCPRAP
jgi:hypothetical protein